jgi:hypothetical protein
MTADPERHPRTQAAKTTTSLENAKTKPPTVEQRQADLKETLTPKPTPKPAATVPALIDTTNHTVNLDKLDQWLALPYTDFSFHGIDGDFPSMNGDKVPPGSTFVVLVSGITHGFIRFHGEGEKPTIVETRACDNSPDVTREELGDLDPAKWESGLDGTPRDPFQEQFCVPMVDRNGGGEVFRFVARNGASIRAVRRLLGVIGYHPNGRAGWLPVIKIGAVTYFNRRFKRDMPKPVLGVIDWIAPEGDVPAGNTPPPSPPKLSGEMNDEIAF